MLPDMNPPRDVYINAGLYHEQNDGRRGDSSSDGGDTLFRLNELPTN